MEKLTDKLNALYHGNNEFRMANIVNKYLAENEGKTWNDAWNNAVTPALKNAEIYEFVNSLEKIKVAIRKNLDITNVDNIPEYREEMIRYVTETVTIHIDTLLAAKIDADEKRLAKENAKIERENEKAEAKAKRDAEREAKRIEREKMKAENDAKKADAKAKRDAKKAEKTKNKKTSTMDKLLKIMAPVESVVTTENSENA